VLKKLFIYIIQIILFFCINNEQVYAALKINCDNMYLGVNHTLKLNATGASSSVVWKSSNPDTIIVDSNGLITAKKVGTAYVQVVSGSESDMCRIDVINNYVPVSSISLSQKEITLLINEKIKIPASVLPANSSNRKIIYKSNNPSVASVDENGNVVTKKVGTAQISLSIENKSYIYKVTVIDKIALKSIAVQSSMELKEQETGKLSVTYTPSNATNKKVTWKSSNNDIVTVDSNGNLKAIAPGEATITVVSNDGGHVATSKIIVIAIDKSLKGIKLNESELTLNVEEIANLSVIFNPEYAENKNVVWSSTNKKIATVEAGKVVAVKPGKTQIKVVSEDGEHEAICEVTVLSLPIESIDFEFEEQTVYVGSETTLNTISTPKDTFINEPIWSSSDETIATIKDGVLTAKRIGTVTVTISSPDGEITASTIVKIIEKPEEPLMIIIDGYDLNFDKNTKNYTLTIGNESSLNIKTNIDSNKVTINGNRDLKNGSIITISIKDKEKVTYVINIKKKENHVIYFIAIISVLLLLNIIRMLIKNKKKKR